MEPRRHDGTIDFSHDDAPPAAPPASQAETLAGPADAAPDTAAGTAPLPPVGTLPELPGYAVAAEVGRGGMGVVYKATHLGLNRPVAIKMVIASRATQPEDLVRFRLEAEMAARVRHPNVVQVYESGAHAGEMYLALEWVEGGTLGDCLDSGPLDPAAAARLVELLARAVHAAHCNGIVHRDLKPGNVLLQPAQAASGSGSGGGLGGGPAAAVAVRPGDERVPKVTDFGLARQMDTDSNLTDTGRVMGTPEYMAPEQAAGRTRHTGPPADVHALGVILYHCLTGRTPFKGDTLVHTLRRVVEEQPLPPRRLAPHLPRDLETITLKCLEKEPGRRYPTAEALAADLQRLAENRPILARPAGAGERAWKWTRRNPAVAALTAAVVAAFLAGFAGVTRQWYAADRQRARAVAAEADALKSADDARRAAAEAAAVNHFLVSDLLASAAPDKALGRALTVADVLATATARLDGAFPDQPGVEAAVRQTIGNAYRSLGLYDKAGPQLRAARDRRAALDPDGRAAVDAALDLGLLQHAQGNWADAEATYRDAAARAARTLDADDTLAVRADARLAALLQDKGDAAEAERLFRRALDASRRISSAVEHDPDTVALMNDLAILLTVQRRFPEADALLSAALAARKAALPPAHPAVLESLNNLAGLRSAEKRYAAARPLYEQVLAGRRAVLTATHPDTLTALNNLAQLVAALDGPKAAIPLYREAVAGLRAALPPDHAETLIVTNNLAVSLLRAGDFDEAETLFRAVLAARERVLPADHAQTLQTRNDLGALLFRRGRGPDAAPLLRAALAGRRKVLGPAQADTLTTAANLVRVLRAVGERAPAAAVAQETAEACFAALGPAASETLAFKELWAGALLDQGRWDEAAGPLGEALAARRAGNDRGPDAMQTLVAAAWLARHRGDPAGAERLLTEAIIGLRALRPGGHPSVAAAQLELADLLTSRGRPDSAAWLAGAAAGPVKMVAARQPGDWLPADARGVAAGIRAARGQPAEPALLEAYRDLRAANAPAARVRAAWERVAAHYAATGQAAKAADWARQPP